MDEAEGFFPERRLLAYRRSLLSAEPVPASTVRQNGSGWQAWWILLVCMGPSYFAIWVSMSPRQALFKTYFLVTSALIVAVLGISVGIYRGLRTEKPLTPQ